MSERLIWEARKVRSLLALSKEELATFARNKLSVHYSATWLVSGNKN